MKLTLHPLDVGFDPKVLKMAVTLPDVPHLTVTTETDTVTGTTAEVAGKLRQDGWKIKIRKDGDA